MIHCDLVHVVPQMRTVPSHLTTEIIGAARLSKHRAPSEACRNVAGLEGPWILAHGPFAKPTSSLNTLRDKQGPL